MENHPIPQDVTGFQFKLIGNMTVKQFAYLATGIVFAWILWQLPVNVLIKFPFCAFSAILGAGLAFFPVAGRPMDLMIGNYIKALFRPTQFIYEKAGGQIYFPHKTPLAVIENVKQYKNDLNIFPKDKLKVYLESLSVQPKNKLPVSGHTSGNNISQPHSDSPKPEVSAKPVSLEQIKISGMVLKRPSGTISAPIAPDSPNLITGITKDARGNALPNILVEVRDKDNNPVRAFKTNELGRFASATPLANGIYAIEFEDPKAQNRFEKMTINAIGQIILPIAAISIDTREELRRSLFNAN